MFRKTLLIAAVAGCAFSAAPARAHGTFCAQPFQKSAAVLIKAGYGGSVGSFTVPAGSRLQIEYVSASLRHTTNDGRGAFAIGTTAGGQYAWHPLPILTGYALSDRMTSQQVDLYAEGGTVVNIEINRATGTNVDATGRYAVTGCLYPAQ